MNRSWRGVLGEIGNTYKLLDQEQTQVVEPKKPKKETTSNIFS
jgi:hypothetical protein